MNANMTGSSTAKGLRARVLFLLAGLVVGVTALAFTVSGGQVSEHTTVFGTNPLTITFAVLALALFAAIGLNRVAARSVGVLAALVFGAAGLLAIYHSWVVTGSPFALALWLPMVAAALLSAAAAWQA